LTLNETPENLSKNKKKYQNKTPFIHAIPSQQLHTAVFFFFQFFQFFSTSFFVYDIFFLKRSAFTVFRIVSHSFKLIT